MRLGIPELILILAIVILLFGTSRLAGLGKGGTGSLPVVFAGNGAVVAASDARLSAC